MSSKFHNKFHRHNHHTTPIPDPRYPDAAHDPIASQLAPFLGTFWLSSGDIQVVNGEIYTQSGNSVQWSLATSDSVTTVLGIINSLFLPLTGGTIDGPGTLNVMGLLRAYNGLQVTNNLTVFGDISATGNSYFANTVYSTTSALSVVNLANNGPALYVGNNGSGDLASFYDIDTGTEVFHIGGQNGSYPNIGVKTSTPNQALTVKGSVSASDNIYSGNVIYVPNGNSDLWNSARTNVWENSAVWNIGAGASTIVKTNSANWIYNNGNTYGANVTIGTNDNFNLALETNNTPRITILNSGDVGIGTINPVTNARLDIAGGGLNIAATGNTSTLDASLHIKTAVVNDRMTQIQPSAASKSALNLMASTDGSNNNQWWSWGVDSNVWKIQPGTNFSGSNGLFINNSGNVGIGVNPPSTKLHVGGDITGQNINVSTGYKLLSAGQDVISVVTAAAAGVTGSGTTNYVPKWSGSNTLGDSTIVFNGTNVGIGTTTADRALQVVGGIRSTNGFISDAGVYSGLSIQTTNTTDGAASFIDAPNRNGAPDSCIFFRHQSDGGSRIEFHTQPPGDFTDRRQNRVTIDTWGSLIANHKGLIVGDVGTSYSNAFQVREANLNNNGNTTDAYRPRLGFHWGNVVASSISLRTDGAFSFDDNPGTGLANIYAGTVNANLNGNATSANYVTEGDICRARALVKRPLTSTKTYSGTYTADSLNNIVSISLTVTDHGFSVGHNFLVNSGTFSNYVLAVTEVINSNTFNCIGEWAGSNVTTPTNCSGNIIYMSTFNSGDRRGIANITAKPTNLSYPSYYINLNTPLLNGYSAHVTSIDHGGTFPSIRPIGLLSPLYGISNYSYLPRSSGISGITTETYNRVYFNESTTDDITLTFNGTGAGGGVFTLQQGEFLYMPANVSGQANGVKYDAFQNPRSLKVSFYQQLTNATSTVDATYKVDLPDFGFFISVFG